jgi:hypothetical protein
VTYGEHGGLFTNRSYAGGLNIGDTAQIAMELNVTNVSGAGTLGPWALDLVSNDELGAIAYDSLSDLPSGPWSGIVVSTPKVLTHNWGSTNVFAMAYIGSSTALSGTFSIGRTAMIKINPSR